MKKETKCLHTNITQVGTETTAEVWCVDCNECIRTYKPFRYQVSIRDASSTESEFNGVEYKRSGHYKGLIKKI